MSKTVTDTAKVTIEKNTQIYCIWQPGGWIHTKHNKNKNDIIITQINRLLSYI